MSRRVPGRLHRMLSPNGAPLFELKVGDHTFTDDTLHSITIHRGTSGPRESSTPSTIEFEVTANHIPFFYNSPIELRLSLALAQRIAADSAGTHDDNSLRWRFNGRGANQSITDIRTGLQQTTATGTSWAALLFNAARLVPVQPDELICNLLERALSHPAYLYQVRPAFALYSDFDRVQGPVESMPFQDVISKYGTGLGVDVQYRRGGETHLVPLVRKREILFQRLNTFRWPVLRSEVLSPASWHQPLETASEQYVWKYATANGSEYETVWPIPVGLDQTRLRRTEVDWRHATYATENYRHLMDALTITANQRRTSLNTVSFDLLHLITSDNPYHRRIASHLIALEAGDPVYFSGDWLPIVRGAYFAQEITETITGQEWTMQLTLSHARNVVGLYENEEPTVDAIAWDSAAADWDSADTTWNDGRVLI